MKSINEFLNKWGNLILVFLVLIITMKTCGISSTTSDNSDQVKELNSKVDSLGQELKSFKENTASKEELDVMQDEMMYDFLLYEKELDDGKITLTQVKEETKAD